MSAEGINTCATFHFHAYTQATRPRPLQRVNVHLRSTAYLGLPLVAFLPCTHLACIRHQLSEGHRL